MGCVRFSVYVVEIRYWSRSLPTYIRKDFQRHPLDPEVGRLYSSVASFGTKEEAEAAATLFAALYPKYIGCLSVAAIAEDVIATLRDED